MNLNELNIGEKAIIKKILFKGKLRLRIRELGFVEGSVITSVEKSMFCDPVAYQIRGSVVALRNSDAEKIIIEN